MPMTEAEARSIVQDLRYKYLGKKQANKADLMVGLWLNLKLLTSQRLSQRQIKKQEKEIAKFFDQEPLQKLLEAEPELGREAIYQEILDSARIYQEACRTDPHYGSKLFNLVKLKDDELADKAGQEVYRQIIKPLLMMDQSFWRDQMVCALHQAYQEVFKDHALKAELYFSDQEDYQVFDRLVRESC